MKTDKLKEGDRLAIRNRMGDVSLAIFLDESNRWAKTWNGPRIDNDGRGVAVARKGRWTSRKDGDLLPEWFPEIVDPKQIVGYYEDTLDLIQKQQAERRLQLQKEENKRQVWYTFADKGRANLHKLFGDVYCLFDIHTHHVTISAETFASLVNGYTRKQELASLKKGGGKRGSRKVCEVQQVGDKNTPPLLVDDRPDCL